MRAEWYNAYAGWPLGPPPSSASIVWYGTEWYGLVWTLIWYGRYLSDLCSEHRQLLVATAHHVELVVEDGRGMALAGRGHGGALAPHVCPHIERQESGHKVDDNEVSR